MVKAGLFMVFDVESVGLHGEGFAFGYVVVDLAGRERGAGRVACDPDRCRGTPEGRAWAEANCPGLAIHCDGARELRRAFWLDWLNWKARGAALAADCPWPVEARFLAACVEDERPVIRGGHNTAASPRDREGPYPLIDVASVRLAAGLDPLGTDDRRPDELPVHDPLADARQSARLLIEALQKTWLDRP